VGTLIENDAPLRVLPVLQLLSGLRVSVSISAGRFENVRRRFENVPRRSSKSVNLGIHQPQCILGAENHVIHQSINHTCILLKHIRNKQTKHCRTQSCVCSVSAVSIAGFFFSADRAPFLVRGEGIAIAVGFVHSCSVWRANILIQAIWLELSAYCNSVILLRQRHQLPS